MKTKQILGTLAVATLAACAPTSEGPSTQNMTAATTDAAATEAACDPSAKDAAQKFSGAAQAYKDAQTRATLEKLVEACTMLEQTLGSKSCQIKLDEKSEPTPISFESKKNDCLGFKTALDKIKKDEDVRPVVKLPPPPESHPMDKKTELKKLSLKVVSMSQLRRVMSLADDGLPPRALVDGEPMLRPAMSKAVNENGKVGCWFTYNKASLQDGMVLNSVVKTKSSQPNPAGQMSVGFAFETPEKDLIGLVCIAKDKAPTAKQIRLSLYGVLDIVSYE